MTFCVEENLVYWLDQYKLARPYNQYKQRNYDFTPLRKLACS